MSVRHQMRSKVERLFKLMIEDPDFPEEETVVYAVFVPREGEVEEEKVDVSEQEVSPEEAESVKRFLDRTTRESLEAEVKGLKLYGYVFESKKGLKMITEESEDLREIVFTRIERMREEM